MSVIQSGQLHLSKFLVSANFDLVTQYILRMKNKWRFRKYIVCVKIPSTFHAWVKYISVLKYTQNAIQTNEWKPPQPPPPLARCIDPSNIRTFNRPNSSLQTPNGNLIASRTFTQLRNKVLLVTMRRPKFSPKFTPKIALTLGRSPPHLMLWAWRSSIASHLVSR